MKRINLVLAKVGAAYEDGVLVDELSRLNYNTTRFHLDGEYPQGNN